MVTVGGTERKGKKKSGWGQRDSRGDLSPPEPSTASVSRLHVLQGFPEESDSQAARPFSNQTPYGRRHVCDLVQSPAPEGGNAKFLPAPVAAVDASWIFFFFLLLPAAPGFWFLESLGE